MSFTHCFMQHRETKVSKLLFTELRDGLDDIKSAPSHSRLFVELCSVMEASYIQI